MTARTVIFSIVLTVAAGVFLLVPISAQDGEAIFNSLRCGSCHKPDVKATAASLNEIAKAYADPGKLFKFLNGEARPIIETDKPGMMKGQMQKIALLPEQEKQALAQYVFRFK